MRILLSNDDGVHATGIKTLYAHLSAIADVTVIAPDRNCSGASNSLTITNPLRTVTLDNGFVSVNGTPTDCVHLGINQLMTPEPDLVISGINHGPNLADDVIYSGTIAAATEGRHMGSPAIAVSLSGNQHFETAAKVVVELVKKLKNKPIAADQILNVNVPDVDYMDLSGLLVTRCGARHRAETMTQATDPYGRTIYWYGPAGSEADAGPGTDFYAVANKFVSITPLSVDMTAHHRVEALSEWIAE